MSEQATETVMRKEVVVARAPADAFRVYTEGIATWWPLRTHSVSGEDAETVVFEPGVGGRIYERAKNGTEHVWGTVAEWEPPLRVRHTWHPGRSEETEQDVEIRFVPDGNGTRVEIEHRGWEKLGADAERTCRSYDVGWDFVLRERFAAAASRA